MSAETLKTDARYIQGEALHLQRKYDDAIELFSNILQTESGTYGDKSIEMAPVWYKYGLALLRKEQDNPSEDLLAAARAEANDAVGQLSAEDEEVGEEEDEEEAAEDGDDEGGLQRAEDDSDLNIAWEALELARLIYTSHQCPEYDRALADTYRRLGDFQNLQGSHQEALHDYGQCLALQNIYSELGSSDDNRDLSETHMLIATAHIYMATDEGHDPKAEKAKALSHYRQSKEFLAAAISSCQADSRADLELSMEELTETVDALHDELVAVTQHTATGPTTFAFGNPAAVQTSGFGFPQSTTSSIPTPNIFQNSAISGSRDRDMHNVPLSTDISAISSSLQVRKKVKVSEVAISASKDPDENKEEDVKK